MTTIADLLREQQATDVLVTRAYRAQLGFALGKPQPVSSHQMRMLHRLQIASNQRLEALVERMEKANASKEKDPPKLGPEHWPVYEESDP